MTGITRKRVDWILDADIKGFFDNMNHQWLLKFLKHRIADKRVLRLIKQWLKAGVYEDGQRRPTEVGCPQGAVISPLLANIYLHYVLDMWVNSRRKGLKGDMIIVRYADDYVAGFENEWEAKAFVPHLKDRLAKFGLSLHSDKTKLIRFGRFARRQCKKHGEGKPQVFEFLGFTHSCSVTRTRRRFIVRRTTSKKRMRKTLQAIKEELKKRRHDPVVVTGKWLNQVIVGYYNYYAVSGNLQVLNNFQSEIGRYWIKALRRRSQRSNMTWDKFAKLVKLYIPSPWRVHDYPNKRFDARYAR